MEAENRGRQDSYERAKKDGVMLKRKWIATYDMRTRHAHALLDGQLAEVDEPFESELGPIMFPGDHTAHPSNIYNCRCTLGVKYLGFDGKKTKIKSEGDRPLASELVNKKTAQSGLTNGVKSDIINKQELFKKKSAVESPERKPISQKRFDSLTIEARKNGANIIRCNYGDEFYLHLERNQATASCVGDTLIFRPDATVSEVLEETFHFSQNLMQTNSNQPVGVRVLMNEIEAKEYIIRNAKKYSVPRSEIEVLNAQLKSYKTELNKVLGKE